MENLFNQPKWIEINSTGSFTKNKYFGRFLLKPYLTHGEKAEASRLAEVYCRGIDRDTYLVQFLTTLAYLKFYVVKTDADWWNNEDFGLSSYDEEPIWELSAKLGELRGNKDEVAEPEAPAPTKKTKA